MTKIIKTPITEIVVGNPVNPAVANAPNRDLETNIDNILSYINAGSFGSFEYDSVASSGLSFAYTAGRVRKSNSITLIDAGTISLTASKSNYVSVDPSTMTVKTATTGFISHTIPLWIVTTSVTAITGVTDKRAVFTANGAVDISFSSSSYVAANVHDALEEVDGRIDDIIDTELVKYIPETNFKSSLNGYALSVKADAYSASNKTPVHIMPVSAAGGWPSDGIVVSYWTGTQECTQAFISRSNDVQIREVHTTIYPNWTGLTRIKLSGADISLASSNFTATNVKSALDELDGRLDNAVSTESSHYTSTTSSINTLNGQVNDITNVQLPKYIPEANFTSSLNQYSLATKADAYSISNKKPLHIMAVNSAGGWPSDGTVTSYWWGEKFCTQIFVSFTHDIQTREVHEASYPNWTSLYKVWTSANDGSGSGLDADLLDGQQGGYYYPKAGGRINGAVGIGTDPALTLSFNDPDTGFNWVSDGRFQLRTNNQVTADFHDNTAYFANRPYVGGSYTIVNTDFENVRALTGYTKLPNGLIFQWGQTPGNGTFTLPLTFPNAALASFVTSEYRSTGGTHQSIASKLLSTSTIYLDSENMRGPFHYFAIGW